MIILDNKYKIDADGAQYILFTPTGTFDKKTGAEKREIHGYYSKLANAIRAYCEIQNMDYIHENDITLREAVKQLDDTYEKIRNLEL